MPIPSRPLLLTGLLLLTAPLLAGVANLSGREAYVPGEILVRFEEGAPASVRSKSLGAIGSLGVHGQGTLTRVRLKPGTDVREAVELAKRQAGVKTAQPNFRYYALGTCPSLPTDGYHAGYATAASWPFLKIQMDKAVTLFNGWTSCPPAGSVAVTVAILDSGISRNHPDLQPPPLGNVPPIGYNAICDTGSQAPSCSCGAGVTDSPIGPTINSSDDFGHGTYVAGIVGAFWNQGLPNTESGSCAVAPTSGVAGTAPSAVLMSIKVLDCTGSGSSETVSAGIRFAVDHGARVLNLSLGSSAASGLDDLQKDALDYALAHDCTIVASSGNESQTGSLIAVDYPAAYPPVLAVGATDQNDQVSYYSNGGGNLDLVAPGGSGDFFTGNALNDSAHKIFGAFICPLSAAAQAEGGFEPLASDANFGDAAGTSASAPFVSGAVALLMSVYPSLTHAQVEEALVNNTDSLNGGKGWDTQSGYGRLNVYRALLNAGTGGGQVTSYLKTFNSPNPFYTVGQGSTNITLAITQAAPVELTIYDASGEVVLHRNYDAAGLNQNPSQPQYKSYYIPWDGKNGAGQPVVTGIYFYSVKVNGQEGRNKIAVIQGSK